MTAPRDTQTTTERTGDDSATRVARITRTSAIVTAVITALATVVTAAITGYFAGKEQGSKAAPAKTVTVPAPASTVTVTASGRAPSSDAPPAPVPGEVRLVDETPVEGEGEITIGSATVRHEKYERALLMDAEYGGVVKYNITPGARTFHALVGLTDDSPSCTATFELRIEGETVRKATVKVGETSELAVPLEKGFRLGVAVNNPDCDGATAAIIDPVLRP